MNKLLFNGHELVVKTKKIHNIMGKYSELGLQEKITKLIKLRKFVLGIQKILGRKEIFPQTQIPVILCIESWDGVCILS